MDDGQSIDTDRCARCGSGVDTTGCCGGCMLELALARPEPPDLDGEKFGPYEIGRVRGQGGMGVVYEAVDTRPTSPRYRRKVALKIPAGDPRETQLAGSLHHEHIVPVYEVDDHEGIPYFTMMLVDGDPLAIPKPLPDVEGRRFTVGRGLARLKRRATMTRRARRAADVALKVARAVHFAHSHGILHRDLKPANVLVNRETEQPLVADFGLAVRREDAAGGMARPTGGTPEYMAPERWAEKALRASTLEDIWSVGVILYELLAGHRPFRASSIERLREKIVSESELPPPLEGVPADLAAICLQCLEKDASRRYATADDLAGDLERFLADDPVHARPLGWASRCLRAAKRRPFLTAFSLLLFIVISIATAAHQAAERSRTRTVQQAVGVANNLADRLADLTALRFERYTAALATVAQDPLVARAIADPSLAREVFDRLIEQPLAPRAAAFATSNLFDTKGTLLARAPSAVVDNRGRSYAFRDYFHGAAELGKQGVRGGTHVARAHQSEADGSFEIAISAPVFDATGRWIGVLLGGLFSGSTLGSIELPVDWAAGLSAALLAPRDRQRGQAEPDPNPVLIVHPQLGVGEARTVGPEDVLGTGGYVRVAPVRGTPFSVLVRVAFDGQTEGIR